jgi:hypothetical protein
VQQRFIAATWCDLRTTGDTFNQNGGWPPTGMGQGDDPIKLPKGRPTVWARGSVVEVAWGMWANHGGGYSYRICPLDNASEACFQRHPLDFVNELQYLQHLNGSRFAIPRVMLDTGALTPIFS